MLRLITGRAGAGKTALIMDEIRAAALAGQGERLLVVPEQYSHEAERELARVAGPRMALHAEVLSFTGLARRVAAELGPREGRRLDPGGRLLCMALAVEGCAGALRFYGGARRSPEQQLQLLGALDELRAAALTPEALSAAAQDAGGALGGKLADLALLMEAFESAAGGARSDPSAQLTQLLEDLPRSSLARAGHIYIDGFTDFTRVEERIVESLLPRGADVTVCLTLDSLDSDNEVFELSRRTARRLLAAAHELGVGTDIVTPGAAQEDVIGRLAAGVFSYGGETQDAQGRVLLRSAAGVTAECAFAAARCLELARGGCRWRDIAVAVRGFEDYRCALEAAFAAAGVPLFTARRADVLSKPLPALIAGAYEIILGGWEQAEVFSYLRTGLAGLTDAETDKLENYCCIWSIRARHWLGEGDWRMPPEGAQSREEGSAERLAEINGIRRRAARPLLALYRRASAAGTARGQAQALSAFFDDLDLAERLAQHAEELEAAGRRQAADEYSRLWEAAVSALEQAAQILGDTPMDAAEFSRLYLLALSQCGVGGIPVALDMVTAGDFDRMRRRHIRHLIVLGASEERLPRAPEEAGVFSAAERRELAALGCPLDAGDAELWREYSLIYNCLSLPAESVTLVTPTQDAEGAAVQPSVVVSRAARLFGLQIRPVDMRAALAASRAGAMELAAAAERSPGPWQRAAARWYEENEPRRIGSLRAAARRERGALSAGAARALYGRDLRLTASRVERFASCRFAYFMSYGLRAKTLEPADFSPPAYGEFMHYVLQHVAQEAEALGGFGAAPEDQLSALAEKYVERYIEEELGGFEGRSARFIYLFRRLGEGVRRVVLDMAAELRDSDFRPIGFELDFSRLAAPRALPDGGTLTLAGIADRVDGWLHNGRLYLRVVDYKTGKKSFSLSDVYYGLGLQMLLYLFTLSDAAPELYGYEGVPAGVLYVPARDVLISAQTDLTDAEIAEKRREALRRSGLLLGEPEALAAMEHTEGGGRLPIKWKDGAPAGESLASAEQLGALARHVEDTLTALAGELRRGSIEADPYYKGAQENACLYCEYAAACRFVDGEGGESRRYLPHLEASKVWELLERGERNG